MKFIIKKKPVVLDTAQGINNSIQQKRNFGNRVDPFKNKPSNARIFKKLNPIQKNNKPIDTTLNPVEKEVLKYIQDKIKSRALKTHIVKGGKWYLIHLKRFLSVFLKEKGIDISCSQIRKVLVSLREKNYIFLCLVPWKFQSWEMGIILKNNNRRDFNKNLN